MMKDDTIMMKEDRQKWWRMTDNNDEGWQTMMKDDRQSWWRMTDNNDEGWQTIIMKDDRQ